MTKSYIGVVRDHLKETHPNRKYNDKSEHLKGHETRFYKMTVTFRCMAVQIHITNPGTKQNSEI